MRLKINLATRYYLNNQQLNYIVAAVILVTSIAFLLISREAAYNAGEMKRIASEKMLLDEKSKKAVKGVPEAEYNELLARIHFANGIIDKKTVNWLQIFDHLEETVPSGIALTSIEPNAKEQVLKISGVAHSFANLRQLMENFEKSGYFSEVYLLNNVDIKVGVSQKGISFSISCKADFR
jgi:type IV pilus assembly protein PilN